MKSLMISNYAIYFSVGNWARLFRGQVGQLFVFNTGRAHRGNRLRYCANVPYAYCPALARCPNNPIIPINPPITINPPINTVCPANNRINPGCVCIRRPLIGGCCDRRDNTDPTGQRRFFCYVDRTSNCPGRLFASQQVTGLFYSYAPCRNNNNFPFFLRGGREDGDEDAFQRSGELIANDDGEDDDGDNDDGEFIEEVTLDSTNEDLNENSDAGVAP